MLLRVNKKKSKIGWFPTLLQICSINSQTSAYIDHNNDLWFLGNNSNSMCGFTSGTLTSWTKAPISNVEQVAVGATHSLVLKTDGTLWVSGNNNYYAMGAPSNFTSYTQVMTNVKQISTGTYHSAVVKKDGTVWCVGSIGGWITGMANGSSSWQQIATGAAQVCAGSHNTAILKTNGDVYIAGYNSSGTFGVGDTSTYTGINLIAHDCKQVITSSQSTYIVKQNGDLYATGANANGALGVGSTTAISSFSRVLTGVSYVQASGTMALALKTNGTAWGAGTSWPAGDGIIRHTSFTQVAPTGTIIGVGVGLNTGYLLKADNTVWAVGNQAYKQIDGINTTNRTTYYQQATR